MTNLKAMPIIKYAIMVMGIQLHSQGELMMMLTLYLDQKIVMVIMMKRRNTYLQMKNSCQTRDLCIVP